MASLTNTYTLPPEVNNFTRRLVSYKGFLVILVEVIIVFLSIQSFFVPRITEITDYQNKMIEQKEEVGELSSYLSYLTELASLSLGVEEDVINYVLPSENDVISFIVTYEGLAQSEDVEVSPLSIKPGLLVSEVASESGTLKRGPVQPAQNAGDTKKVAGVEELPFTMTVVSPDEERARAFLEKIYKARRIFNIHTLSWQQGKLEDEETISMSLSMVTYYFPETPVRPSAALVQQGRRQASFLEELKTTDTYDQLVLDAVQVGKSDLFEELPASAIKPTAPPQIELLDEEGTESASIF